MAAQPTDIRIVGSGGLSEKEPDAPLDNGFMAVAIARPLYEPARRPQGVHRQNFLGRRCPSGRSGLLGGY